MDLTYYQNISTAIFNQFNQILQTFFENNKDIPKFNLQVQFINEIQNDKRQFAVNADGVSSLENIDMSTYIFFLPKANYYGTFTANNCDAFYYYRCNEIKIYIAFIFDDNKAIEIIKTITKVFVENILKPLSKLMEYKNIGYKEIYYILNFDFDIENIIYKSIIEYFWRFYCLDINLISLLSAQKYETAALFGRIFIPCRGTERSRKDLKIKLSENIKITDNIRRIRKLMEISKGNLGLVLDKKNQAIGYSSYCKSYECDISFNGHLDWEVKIQELCLTYNNGVFRLHTFKEESIITIPNIFNISNEQEKQIYKVLDLARTQKHGTLIIIEEPNIAKSEVKRLCSFGRGINIKPMNLSHNLEIIENITSIDGAILIDTNCICYGIGMILDGEAIVYGNPARGARYNSAVNYTENRKKKGEKVLSVIISEDETIDCYC